MKLLTLNELYKLEDYARQRPDFRSRVMQHKKARRIQIGGHLALYFEDRLTVQYQVQEMLRIERIFEPDAIQEELDAYNPLIPDGSNWKATCMIEYPDENERHAQLSLLRGIEDTIWVQIGQQNKARAVADEDLERSDAEKTSAVHFLRFELSELMIEELRKGAELVMGVDHPEYQHRSAPVTSAARQSLLNDLG